MLTLAGCSEPSDHDAMPNPVGDVKHGAALIKQYGCGECHVIPGIAGAEGVVGPPLTSIARRVYIAGVLRNSPENMMAWLQNPQQFVPGNAMPQMNVSAENSRDLSAYLFTLR